MRDAALVTAIAEAARAATLEELGEAALPALGRALHACPVFMARIGDSLATSRALGGELRDTFATYVRDYVVHDPLGRAALASAAPVMLLDRVVDARTMRASPAYAFHRAHDFDDHLLLRVHGRSLATPGTIAIGLTRGRRMRRFDRRDAAVAALALPAFRGAAERILRAAAAAEPRVQVTSFEALTRAERDTVEALALGLTNAAIARRFGVSLDTVKTHLHRAYRKLGVSSRTQALLALRAGR